MYVTLFYFSLIQTLSRSPQIRRPIPLCDLQSYRIIYQINNWFKCGKFKQNKYGGQN